MNEAQKTLAFVGAGLLVLLLAFFTRPAPLVSDKDEFVGEIINRLEDPADARGLKIIKFDEETATRQEFEVAHDGTRWVIPSHDNHPADAETQMADAATSVMNREILGMESDEAGDHAMYGVVDPGDENIVVGADGVGIRVTMTDKDGKALANLVIGKEVQEQEGQRYVRQVDQDAVFVVTIDPSDLSTEFEDWIEDDLLKLSPFDIDVVEVNDYSSAPALGPNGLALYQEPRSRFRADFNRDDSKWELKEMEVADPATNQLQPALLSETEELQQQPLNDLKNALDDLKIIDVAPKPAGLSADLQASVEAFSSNEAIQSLQERGFYAVPMREDESKIELISSEGEVFCLMREGLEYVLRFGHATSVIRGEDTSAEEGSEEDEASRALGRYILVTTRVNTDKIPAPDLKPLPDTIEETAVEEETTESGGESDEAAEDSATEEAAAAAEDEATDEVSDAATAETTEDEVDDEADDAETGEDADEASAEDPEALEIARNAIQEENDRRQKEYDDKLAAVQEKVDELNARFADWYYIISDETYQKIRLSREDIVGEKEQPEGEEEQYALQELNSLEAQGLGEGDGE